MFYGVPVWIIPGLLRAISAEALGTRLGLGCGRGFDWGWDFDLGWDFDWGWGCYRGWDGDWGRGWGWDHSRTQSPSYARCDEGLWPNPKPETIKTW